MANQTRAPSTGTIVRDSVSIIEDDVEKEIPIAPDITEESALAQHAEQSFVSSRMQENMHISDIESELISTQGMDTIDARNTVLDTLEPMVASEVAAGASNDQIRTALQEQYGYPDDLLADLFDNDRPEYEPPLLVDVTETNENTKEGLDELVASARNVHSLQMPFIKNIIATASEDKAGQRKYQRYNTELSIAIANTLRKLGRTVEVGEDNELVEITEAGPVPIDESILYDIAASENELIGSAAGGVLAYQAINTLAATPGFGKFGWLAKKALVVGGTIAGSSIGASAGRALDVLHNSIKVKEEVDARTIMAQMEDAGIANATWEAIGTPLFYGGFKLIKGLGRARDIFFAGNKEGAYRALKDLMHLTDQQVDDVIIAWEKATGEQVTGMTRAKRALKVIPLSVPGGEAILVHAAGKSAKAGTDVAHAISVRAKDLLHDTGRMTNENIGTVLHDELGKYTNTVKDFYTDVKNIALDATEDSVYQFDYDKLAIDPLMERINVSLTNESVRKRFGYYMEQIRSIGNVAEGEVSQIRSFSDLLDLRKTVNEFKAVTKIRKKEDFEAVKAVLSTLDSEIAKVAKKEIPNGKTWLKTWRMANVEYSKMFKLKENVLYKAMTKKGVDTKKIVKALQNNVTAIDGTFMQVVAKLPKRVQEQAEGAILDSITKKFTIGFESGAQAIHFPNLAEELKFVGFTSPTARAMKRGINEMAKVFKNDVNLAQSVGQVNSSGFQHYLTTDPTARIKYEVANTAFDYIKRLLPGQEGRNRALITNVAKLIENPANSKRMAAVLKDLPADAELRTSIRRMAIEFAKFGEKETYPKVKVYRTGVPGSTHKAKDGPLGKGIYWSTNQKAMKKRSRTTGGKLIEENMLPSRIATDQTIKDILGVEDFDMSTLKTDPSIVEMLKKNNYDGISVGDDIVVFK